MSKRPSIRLLLIALLTIGTLVSSSAQNPAPQTASRAAAPATVPKVAVETFTLDNGLQVIVSRRPELPVVAVNTWYHVGPANEAAGRTGFAHLFEHMMFQASKHVPEDSYFRLLESAGASDINGSTNFDFTNYFQTLPTNQVELALWLESDRMGYLLDVVDEKSFANQQDIVRNERRQSTENQPYGMAEEAVFQLLFPKGHPYHGVVIGSHEDIQAAKLADVKQFFKEFYGPNNATVSIVGDIEPREAVKLAQKYFGSIKRSPAVKKLDVPMPRITSEQRRVVPSRVELPKVYMAWITPPFFKPGDAEADVTATILGGGRSSRLYKKLVYEKQIAQNVTAYQVLTLARFHVPDRGHCASRPYRRGAGEGDRRGVGCAGGATAGRERGDSRAQPVRDVHGEQPRKHQWSGQSAQLVQPLRRLPRLRAGGLRPVQRHHASLGADVRP